MPQSPSHIAQPSPPVDRPFTTLVASIGMFALCAWGFYHFGEEAQNRASGASAAVRALAISGAVTAMAMGAVSLRLLRKAGQAVPTEREQERMQTRVGAGIGFGVAAVLAAIQGAVAYLLYGALFGGMASLCLIAGFRSAAALLGQVLNRAHDVS